MNGSWNADYDVDAEEYAERYELSEAAVWNAKPSRRSFGKTLGAGVVIAVTIRPAIAQRGGQAPRRDEMLSQRFHLGEDGVVTVLTSKVECGQGARTELTQAACEELSLPMDRVRLIMADTELCPNDGGTAGSRTTPATVPRVRAAAATLRRLLIAVVAEQLKVPAAQIAFSDGVFRAPQREQTLAALAKDNGVGERLNATAIAEGGTVGIEHWSILGTSVNKIGGADTVRGISQFPSDIQLPGMLYGKVLRPPTIGSTLNTVDAEAANAITSATIVRDGNFIGCVAPTSWAAAQARDTLVKACTWNNPSQPVNSQNVYEHFKKTARENQADGRTANELKAALNDCAHKLSLRFEIPYIQHAPMEPRAAVAQWTDQKLTVWTGTQMPDRVHSELRQAFGLSNNQVRVIVPDMGGGFGGKHTGEVAVEAARLSKGAGKPVSLRWTRDEEFMWAYFRPAGLIEVSAGLDAEGRLIVWDFVNYNSGGSAVESPYKITHARSRYVAAETPLRQGSYRALASTANTFGREAAMDELAALAKKDPLEFRLQHLADGRLKDVLKAVTDKFAWRDRVASTAEHNKNQDGQSKTRHGVGVACGTEKGSFVATCVELEVVDKEIHLKEVCQAYECGAVLNPNNLRAQNTGAIMMGLGGALFESIQFADGVVKNGSFSSYRVPRMRDMPKLTIVQLNRTDLPSVGAGETPIIGLAPAIANAVAHATGIRCHSLPVKV